MALSADDANRRIIGGVLLAASAVMPIALYATEVDPAWLRPAYFWVGISAFLIGGYFAISGLRTERSTVHEDWLRTIQFASAMSVLGAILALFAQITLVQRVALTAIAVVNVLMNWAAGRARLSRRG